MSQKKKVANQEVILIDSPIQQSKSPKKPERILKKQKLASTGELKFLVKWQGKSAEESTWESEELMKKKFNELIEDYEFFNLTGERFDDSILESKRKQKELRKQQNIVSQQTDEFEDNNNINTSTHINNEQTDNEKNQKIQLKPSSYTQEYIQKVELIEDNNAYAFRIQWEPKTETQEPLQEQYNYQKLTEITPSLVLHFLECYIADKQQQNQIIFTGPNEDKQKVLKCLLKNESVPNSQDLQIELNVDIDNKDTDDKEEKEGKEEKEDKGDKQNKKEKNGNEEEKEEKENKVTKESFDQIEKKEQIDQVNS